MNIRMMKKREEMKNENKNDEKRRDERGIKMKIFICSSIDAMVLKPSGQSKSIVYLYIPHRQTRRK